MIIDYILLQLYNNSHIKEKQKRLTLPGQSYWWWGVGIWVWSEGLWPVSLQFDHPPEYYTLNPMNIMKAYGCMSLH